MKKIIRLTESDLTRIVRRVIKEQAPLGLNLSKPTPNLTRGIGRLGRPDDGPDSGGNNTDDYYDCSIKKPMDKQVKEVFDSLEKSSQGSPSDKIKKYIIRLKNSMEGIGSTDDVYNVFKEVKDKSTISSIIKNWKSVTKSSESLYEWISSEMTIRWVVLYSILESNNFYGVKFNRCLKGKTYSA